MCLPLMTAKTAAPAKSAAAPRMDTASILGAARAKPKPGPITKAEAAQQPAIRLPAPLVEFWEA